MQYRNAYYKINRRDVETEIVKLSFSLQQCHLTFIEEVQFVVFGSHVLVSGHHLNDEILRFANFFQEELKALTSSSHMSTVCIVAHQYLVRQKRLRATAKWGLSEAFGPIPIYKIQNFYFSIILAMH